MSNSKSSSVLFRILFILTVALLAVGTVGAFASDSQSVSGHFSDPSGAVVAGASVVIQNLLTGDTNATQTDDQGRFEFLLQGRRYRLEVSAAGFRRYAQDGIGVDPAVPIRLDVWGCNWKRIRRALR